MAMMCRTRLIRRFPARDSRCRCWSPEEASNGAAAVPGREVPAGGEAGDVADVAEQAGGPGGADAVQVEQPGAGGLDQLGQLCGGGLDLLVDRFEVGDQLGGGTRRGLPTT